jgi:hypothetical protein
MGHKSHAELFDCPNSNAQYKLVRAEADPVATYRQIECYHCGGPLKGREGQLILKYFLVDRPRTQTQAKSREVDPAKVPTRKGLGGCEGTTAARLCTQKAFRAKAVSMSIFD